MGVPVNTLQSKNEPLVVQETIEPVIMNPIEPEQNATDNKLEEGEIFDDYEDIISSDEELSMRKRIEELESRNAELEKIANISAFFDNTNFEYSKNDKGYKYKRYVETIELSDYDDYEKEKSHHVISKRTPKTKPSKSHTYGRRKSRKSIRSRSRRRKHDQRDYRSDRSDELNVPRGYRTHKKRSKLRSSRKHLTSSKKSILVESISSSEDELFKTNLSRGDLNLALSRDEGHKSRKNLKERLQPKKETKCNKIKESLNVEYDGHASHKKQVNYDSCESTGLEEEELRLIALKSAIDKKYGEKPSELTTNESAYSPSDFDHITAALKSNPSPKNEELSSTICNSMEISPIGSPSSRPIVSPQIINGYQESVDSCCTKPVDMDIVSSNSDSEYPLFFSVNEKCSTIETKTLPSDKENKQIIPSMVVKSESEDLVEQLPVQGSEKLNNNVVFESNQSNNNSDIEAEETALRELLLSNLNKNKNKKNNQAKNKSLSSNKEPNISIRKQKNESFPEQSTDKVTESILKEAVRRLIAQTTKKEKEPSNVVLDTPVISNEVNSEISVNCNKTPSEIQLDKKGSFQSMDQNENKNTINKNGTKVEDHSLELKHPCNLVVTVQYEQDYQTQESTVEVSKQVTHIKTKSLTSVQSTKLTKPIRSKPSVAVKQECNKINIKNNLKSPKTTVREVTVKSPIKVPKFQIQAAVPKTTIKRNVSAISPLSLKRKSIETNPLIYQKKLKYSNTRLIGNIEVPKVKPLIIRLNDSDSDVDLPTSDSNDLTFNPKITFNNDYFDNSSPRSIQMDYHTPRSNSPNIMKDLLPNQIEIDNNYSLLANQPTSINLGSDNFEAKLDEFLKNARENVKTVPNITRTITVSSPHKTPVFVKHLPEASQIEYRNLVKRMKILEVQKEMKMKEIKLKKANIKKVRHSTQQKTISTKNIETANLSYNKESTKLPIINNLLSKGNNDCINNDDDLNQPLIEEPQKIELTSQQLTIAKEPSVQPKTDLLKKYESAYEKKGLYIKQNLKEYLALSDQAKTCNTKKRLMKTRMHDLRKEMESIQKQLAENKHETIKYLSSMATSYKKILNLQSNRDKLFKITNKLGQTVEGNSYSVPGDDKDIKQLMQKVKVEKNLIEGFHSDSNVECNQAKDKLDELKCVASGEDSTQAVMEKSSCRQMEKPESSEKSINSFSDNKEISAKKNLTKHNSAITVCKENKTNLQSVIKTHKNLNGASNFADLVQNSSKAYKEKDMNKMINPKAIFHNIFYKTPTEVVQVSSSFKSGRKIGDDNSEGVPKYVSPLFWLNTQRDPDADGILCPFQLKGQCEDTECIFKHL